VRSSHLCLRRIFGFITVRSSRLWLHHDSSDIINITLRSAQLYRRPSFNVVVIQRGDARLVAIFHLFFFLFSPLCLSSVIRTEPQPRGGRTCRFAAPFCAPQSHAFSVLGL
jgi:hypothetical protein